MHVSLKEECACHVRAGFESNDTPARLRAIVDRVLDRLCGIRRAVADRAAARSPRTPSTPPAGAAHHVLHPRGSPSSPVGMVACASVGVTRAGHATQRSRNRAGTHPRNFVNIGFTPRMADFPIRLFIRSPHWHPPPFVYGEDVGSVYHRAPPDGFRGCCVGPTSGTIGRDEPARVVRPHPTGTKGVAS